MVGTLLAFLTLMAFCYLPGVDDAKKAHRKGPDSVMGMIAIHGRGLIGTGGSWFLFDIMFYANGLFSALVMEDVFGKEASAFGIMKQSLSLSILPMVGFVIAGVYLWTSSYSLRTLQITGFLAMTAIYFALSLFYEQIRTTPSLFVGLYALTFLFANAGPNSTTFILPTVVFKSNTATCHGLSAAMGKLGAMVGTAAMAPLLTEYGPSEVFAVCGVVGLVGAIVTVYFIPETVVRGEGQKPIDSSEMSMSLMTAPKSPSLPGGSNIGDPNGHESDP